MKKRYIIATISIAAVLLVVLVVGFFSNRPTKTLPFRIFEKISEFSTLEGYGSIQNAPLDAKLEELHPSEAYTAIFSTDGGDCVIYAYVFANENDAQTYYKRVSASEVLLDGIGCGSSANVWNASIYYAIDHTRVLSITGGEYASFYSPASIVLSRLSVDLTSKVEKIRGNTVAH